MSIDRDGRGQQTGSATAPSADAFAALARSSPERWSTLRFAVSWPGHRWKTGAVRAWLRRPDALRVESVDGALLRAERQPVPPVDRTDDPMHEDYHWVAMLDPRELADGRDPETGESAGAPLVVDGVRVVEHADRPAWEAIVVPTATYEPRCGCCPLLRTRAVDEREYDDRPENVRAAYADAFRVRLDVRTGVCVLTEELGGPTPGKGHDVRIEAVDEPMDDALFTRPRWSARPWRGWSPAPGLQ